MSRQRDGWLAVAMLLSRYELLSALLGAFTLGAVVGGTLVMALLA